MSNEQKLRDAIKRLLKAHRITVQAPPKTITDAENQLREIENAVKYAEEALATTEPEPTGVPELPKPDEMGDRWLSSHVYTTNQTCAYGEQCWKAGYKHGAWGDKPEPTSKQSLQVEPAVNQQLTTEPFDEREAFEREMSCEEIWGHRSFKKKPDGRYASWCVDLMWDVWQARAAMAKGVKGWDRHTGRNRKCKPLRDSTQTRAMKCLAAYSEDLQRP